MVNVHLMLRPTFASFLGVEHARGMVKSTPYFKYCWGKVKKASPKKVFKNNWPWLLSLRLQGRSETHRPYVIDVCGGVMSEENSNSNLHQHQSLSKIYSTSSVGVVKLEMSGLLMTLNRHKLKDKASAFLTTEETELT